MGEITKSMTADVPSRSIANFSSKRMISPGSAAASSQSLGLYFMVHDPSG